MKIHLLKNNQYIKTAEDSPLQITYAPEEVIEVEVELDSILEDSQSLSCIVENSTTDCTSVLSYKNVDDFKIRVSIRMEPASIEIGEIIFHSSIATFTPPVYELTN